MSIMLPVLATLAFALIAASGLYVMYRMGPTFERWSAAQYGDIESQ